MGFKFFPEDLKQWKVVVVSFITAATFWFFTSLNKEYSTSLEYPITFQYNTDSLIAVKKLPENVDLDVTGGGWSLLKKTAIFQPTPVSINLSDYESYSGLNWLQILPSIREQINDLTIKQVFNDSLNIRIENIRRKWMKPQVDSTSIDFEDDYRMISPIGIQQDSILIIGPESYIQGLGSSFVINLSEQGIDEDFEESVSVISEEQSLILSSPSEINVSFQVEQFNKLAIEVPLEMVNFPTDSSYIPAQPQVQVQFVVQESKQQSYSASDFVVMADYKMMRPSDSSVLAMLTAFPSEAIEVKVLPEIIKVVPNE